MGVNIFGLWTAKGLRMLLGIKNARSRVGVTLAASLAACAIRGESPGLLRPYKTGHGSLSLCSVAINEFSGLPCESRQFFDARPTKRAGVAGMNLYSEGVKGLPADQLARLVNHSDPPG